MSSRLIAIFKIIGYNKLIILVTSKLMTSPLKIKVTAYNKALRQLEEALNQPYSEFIRDAVIQRFEFTYELAWKSLKLQLATLDLVVRSPKETLKVAYQQQLIEDADSWGELHLKRNLTTHTYDETLAEDVYQFIKNKGLKLFQELSTKLEFTE